MAEQESDRRRRSHQEEDRQEGSPLFVLPTPHTEPTPLQRVASRVSGIQTARRGRPRLAMNERSVDRNRAFGETNASNGLADLQHAGRQLEQASSTLRALLDDPVPNLSSPTLEPLHDYPNEAEHNRRVKRRKMDNEKADSGFKGFSYGRYGQVEPGKLKMEIVSCDGGIFSDHGGNYAAENVLKNDSTVYCTKSNRCNLVLRHQGATAFSLKELIIKAPHSGYTAP